MYVLLLENKVWRWIILFADSLKCQRGLFVHFGINSKFWRNASTFCQLRYANCDIQIHITLLCPSLWYIKNLIWTLLLKTNTNKDNVQGFAELSSADNNRLLFSFGQAKRSPNVKCNHWSLCSTSLLSFVSSASLKRQLGQIKKHSAPLLKPI